MRKAFKSENWSVEIKNVQKLKDKEWYSQIGDCEVIWEDPYTVNCCFWLMDDMECYKRLFCGNIKWPLKNPNPSRMWIVETEWKWEGKPGSKKDLSTSMVFYEYPDTPIRVPEDVIEIMGGTPIDQWYNPSI